MHTTERCPGELGYYDRDAHVIRCADCEKPLPMAKALGSFRSDERRPIIDRRAR